MGAWVKGITPEKLMKPFLPKKDTSEILEEREEFFREFYAKRKEVE